VAIFQFYQENRVWQRLDDGAFHFNMFFFSHYLCRIRVMRAYDARTRGRRKAENREGVFGRDS
jgi:hypothetical protein